MSADKLAQALQDLSNAASVHIDAAGCDCSFRMRERGEHLAGCVHFDLSIEINAALVALAAHQAQPPQEPPFLLDGARFKVSSAGSCGYIGGLPSEFNGRWVALVAADDDCHLKHAAPQQAQAPERLALDLLCGLAGEVSTDDPMTAAERIFDHVQAERAAHAQELENCRRNLEGRDALISKWRAGMREIIPQRMGAEAIRERLQSLLRGDVPQQGSNT